VAPNTVPAAGEPGHTRAASRFCGH
jgi:hypothetical protein